jgi:hypothetical protein
MSAKIGEAAQASTPATPLSCRTGSFSFWADIAIFRLPVDCRCSRLPGTGEA